MTVIRFIFRLIVFMAGLAAIVAIFGSAFWLFQQADSNSGITIAEGGPSLGAAPTDPEEFAIYLLLQARLDEIYTPISEDSTEIPFTIEIGESALAVGERLEEMNLVSDGQLFRQFLRYKKLDASLEAGDYTLRRNMNMEEIGQALQKASFEEVVISIPEGWRAEQIAELLTTEGIMDGNEFLAVVQQGSAVEHNLLNDRPGITSYEGYLFPDTYRLPIKAKPEDLIVRMLDNLAAKLPANTFELAAQRNLTFYEVLIYASIVEREAVIAGERPLIAGVYLNRIAEGMFLRADPTVQYAMGYQPVADQWWKTPVTLEEYSDVDSPYNTYLYPGLPPGPIANPGIDSIVAVLQPAETAYLFFMACGGEGEHLFTDNFEQHEQNVAMCQGQ